MIECSLCRTWVHLFCAKIRCEGVREECDVRCEGERCEEVRCDGERCEGEGVMCEV